MLFHVEASRLCQLYWEDAHSREHVAQAKKLAGIQVELTGIVDICHLFNFFNLLYLNIVPLLFSTVAILSVCT